MISNSEFEKLWVLYKTEGEPKGVSINAFCISRGVNYREFNKWYHKMNKSIVPLEIEDAPSSESQISLEMPEEAAYSCHQSVKGGIRVFIRTQDGLQVQKKGLSYQGLVSLVGKLEGLC